MPPAAISTAATSPSQFTAEQRARMDNANRAHSMMLTADGRLHPIVLTGYLADPNVPLDFFREVAGGALVPAVRTRWGEQRADLAQLAVYSAVRADAGKAALFNPFGSFLACECGFEETPLYGDVFFCRVPDPQSGVIAKLSGAHKEMLAFKLLTAQSIFEGIRLDYVGEQEYRQAWGRLAVLVHAHRGEIDAAAASETVSEPALDGESGGESGGGSDGGQNGDKDDGWGSGHSGGRDAEDAFSPSP